VRELLTIKLKKNEIFLDFHRSTQKK